MPLAQGQQNLYGIAQPYDMNSALDLFIKSVQANQGIAQGRATNTQSNIAAYMAPAEYRQTNTISDMNEAQTRGISAQARAQELSNQHRDFFQGYELSTLKNNPDWVTSRYERMYAPVETYSSQPVRQYSRSVFRQAVPRWLQSRMQHSLSTRW